MLATFAHADDEYPGRDFKIPAAAEKAQIEHYAQVFACHFVESEIDDPSKMATNREALLAHGRETASMHGLSGQRAEWYASAYADTLEKLLVPHKPQVGPAVVLSDLLVSTSWSCVEREDELIKSGDNDAINALINDKASFGTVDSGRRIWIETLGDIYGIARIHVEGNPIPLYVLTKELEKGIKQ